jgi:hypothetical protein
LAKIISLRGTHVGISTWFVVYLKGMHVGTLITIKKVPKKNFIPRKWAINDYPLLKNFLYSITIIKARHKAKGR